MRRSLAAALLLAVVGCAYPYTPRALPPASTPAPPEGTREAPADLTPPPTSAPAPAPAGYISAAAEQRAAVTILVSIDGFRADYLTRGVTPTLAELARTGASAAMRPSFPSITFPNHWTLVTGLRPDRSGIVGNRMEDPARPGETFTMATDDPFWWNESEPVWVAAERAGVRTATMFWPGANVGWGGQLIPGGHGAVAGGTRPADWAQFNQQVTPTQRVDTVIDWLRRPAENRPRLITLYFDAVDTAGHVHGPDSPELNAALSATDAQLGRLVAGLQALGQPANLVIVADHGMAASDPARTVALDQVASPADYRIEEIGPYASLFAQPGHEAALAAALLRPHPHLHCWRKEQIPTRLHYGANPRVPPFLCLADDGWTVVRSAADAAKILHGEHGYDPAAPDMAALFVAHGPAFRGGVKLATFDNVDVAPLVARLAGVALPPGDGDLKPFARALQE